MKTSLKLLCLLSAAGVPSLLAAELAGVPLPAGLDAFDAFAAFVVAFVALIAFADYARPTGRHVARIAAPGMACIEAKAVHPLAA